MGVVSAIAALCKAVPALKRLLFSVVAAVKEAKAKARYEAKLDRINSAVDRFRLPDDEGVEWCGGIDQPPAVPGGGDNRAGLDKGGTS